MISIVKADGIKEYEYLSKVRERSSDTDKNVTAIVSEIIENVRKNGDKAITEYTIKFDGKKPDFFEVPKEEIENSVKFCDEKFISTLKKSSCKY